MTSRTITVSLRRSKAALKEKEKQLDAADTPEPTPAVSVTANASPPQMEPQTQLAQKLAPVLSAMRNSPAPAQATRRESDGADPVAAAHPQRRLADTYDPLRQLEADVTQLVADGRLQTAANFLVESIADKSYSQETRNHLKYALNAVSSFASARKAGTTSADADAIRTNLAKRFAFVLEAERRAVTAFNARRKENAEREGESLSLRAASGGKFVSPNHQSAVNLNRQIADAGVAIGRAAVTFVTRNMLSSEGSMTIRRHFNGSTVSSGMYILINDAWVVGMTAAYAMEHFGAGRNALEHKQALLEFTEAVRGRIGNREALETVSIWNGALWAVTFTRADLNILRRACGGNLNLREWGIGYKTAVTKD